LNVHGAIWNSECGWRHSIHQVKWLGLKVCFTSPSEGEIVPTETSQDLRFLKSLFFCSASARSSNTDTPCAQQRSSWLILRCGTCAVGMKSEAVGGFERTNR